MIDLPATGRERVAAGVLVGAAVLFIGFAIPRVAIAGLIGAFTLPLVLLAADTLIAAAVLTRWYPLRPVAQGLAVFGMLVHALVMLRNGPMWTRGCSGVLLLVHSWALVHLFMMTAAEDDEDVDEVGDSGGPDGDSQGHAADPPSGLGPVEFAELVETPVTEVVDLAVPADEGTEPSPEPETETETDREHEREERIR